MSAITVQSIKDQTRNFRLLYLDTFLSGFRSIAGAFAGAYAIHLGATNTEIGLMSSLPSLLVVLVSIPFGRILQKSSRKKLLTLGGISVFRIGYIVMAVAPWIVGSFMSPGLFFVLVWSLVAIPIQFYNIGSVGLVIQLVPVNRRSAVFTMQNLIGSLLNIAIGFLVGQWLSRSVFPGNYQIAFVLSGLIPFLGLFAWLSMRFPPAQEKAIEDEPKRISLISQLKELSLVFHGHPMFNRYVINSILLNIGSWMVGPLFVLYTVRELQASEAWIGNSGSLSSICAMAGLLVGRRLVERWGDSASQRRLVLLMGIYPVLVGMTSSLTLIMIFGAILSLMSPGYSLGNYNLYLKILPVERREDAIAIYNTIMSIGPFIFPLVGVTLAGYFGTGPTLVACGLVGLVGSLSFWIWRIDDN